jgi:hypothetical protein
VGVVVMGMGYELDYSIPFSADGLEFLTVHSLLNKELLPENKAAGE